MFGVIGEDPRVPTGRLTDVSKKKKYLISKSKKSRWGENYNWERLGHA